MKHIEEKRRGGKDSQNHIKALSESYSKENGEYSKTRKKYFLLHNS